MIPQTKKQPRVIGAIDIHPLLRRALAGAVLAVATAGQRAGQIDPPPPQSNDKPQPPHEDDQLEELRARMIEAHEEGARLRALADQEQRKFTADEQKKLDDLDVEFDELDAEVKRRERIKNQRDRLAQPQPRAVRHDVEDEDAPQAQRRQRITGGDAPGVGKGGWGWRSMGEFAKAIITAGKGLGVDQRILAAATTFGSEAANADGGFAIPPDFREMIMKKVNAEDSLLSRTDQQFTSSNKLTVPQDNTTPWQTTGGIQVFWDDEAATYTQSKPALEQLEVKANKATCLVPITDELLEDVPALSRYLPGKVADKFTSKINDSIVNGDGVAKPQGLLNAPSKITVNKEAGQATGTFKFENAVKMYSRMYAPWRSGAIWLMNQDMEPQLQQMVVPGATPAFPAYLPPGGLSSAMYGSLLGRPLVPVEACQALSTEGDIILVNLTQYLTVQKVGGVRSDVSMHLYFDQSMQAFRFIFRIGGQSWWTTVITRQNGTNTLSNIVTLQTR